MKKIFFAFSSLALLAGLASSCSKETPPSGDEEFIVTATIAGNDTKVSYSEDGSTHKLQPSWQTGDKIIGFDENGNNYCYQVRGAGGTTAYFELVKTGEYASPTAENPGNGTVMYMIYAPGEKASNIFSQSLSVDIDSQSDPIPAIMTAKATVADRHLSLDFTNRTAIIGIKSPKMAAVKHTYSSVTLTGSLVNNYVSIGKDSSGEFEMNFHSYGGKITRQVRFSSDGNKKVYDEIYIAVPPISSLSVLTFTADNGERFMVSAPSIEAGRYYYIDSPTFEEDNSIIVEFSNLTSGDTL